MRTVDARVARVARVARRASMPTNCRASALDAMESLAFHTPRAHDSARARPRTRAESTTRYLMRLSRAQSRFAPPSMATTRA
jgi:hypothetical protein